MGDSKNSPTGAWNGLNSLSLSHVVLTKRFGLEDTPKPAVTERKTPPQPE
jgi:hypothetical protein